MQNSTLVGLLAALASGIAIGAQVTLNSAAGRMVGPARAALLINCAGGLLAGIIVGLLVLTQGRGSWHIPRNAALVMLVCGAQGILIVTGVSYSLQRTGVTAGIAALFLGQMIIGVVVDSLGQPGVEAIPLDVRRIAGLIVMAAALALLLPRE